MWLPHLFQAALGSQGSIACHVVLSVSSLPSSKGSYKRGLTEKALGVVLLSHQSKIRFIKRSAQSVVQQRLVRL